VLDDKGNVWLTRNIQDIVSVYLAKDGSLLDVVGASDQVTVAGATACAFGRSGDAEARDTLYVTTTGALPVLVNGAVT
jgi:sugar lactone lactonase YvrE